jgi:hypothetical protein
MVASVACVLAYAVLVNSIVLSGFSKKNMQNTREIRACSS